MVSKSLETLFHHTQRDTLAEEKQTDKLLTQLAVAAVNAAAERPAT